jgi:hypothetical protein
MAKYPRPPQKGPLVIPNCAEVKLKFQQGGMAISNVLHGHLTAAGPLNPGIAESIFSAIKADPATATWFGHLAADVSFRGVDVKDLRAANNPTIESTGLPMSATGTGTPLPQSIAFVITLRTAFSGKGYFGRAYLIGLTQTDQQDSRHFVDTLGVPAIAWLNAVNSAMTAQGLPWVVAQRTLLANTDPAAPPAMQEMRPANVVPINQAVVTDYRMDSQRRRMGR